MVQAIITLNVVVFIAQLMTGDDLVAGFALWPLGPRFEPWQIVTYSVLHGNISHILFNMIGLAMFGADLERIWGPVRFLAYYLASVVSAGLTQLLVSSLAGQEFPTIGASGGVFGLLLAYAVYFPARRIVPLFPPIPMAARTFALVYGAIELGLGVTGIANGVAHFAHLGGMLGGGLLLPAWRERDADQA